MQAIGPEPPPCDRIPSLTKGVTPALRLIGRLGLLGLLSVELLAGPAGAQVIGTVTGLSGQVSVQRAGGVAVEPLALRNEVSQGDLLRTGAGARLRVDLRDGSILSLGANTELKLDHLAQSPPPSDLGSFFTLAGGYLRTVVGRLRPGSIFEIRSPSTVAAVRGTNWIESYSGGTTEIFVAEGSVLTTSATNRGDWALLTSNSDGPYQPTGTPTSLDHKFITEDVPTGLVPISAMGAAAAVRTPAIDALIELARTMTGKHFAAEARTLERLGLSGMNAPQIRRVVDKGSVSRDTLRNPTLMRRLWAGRGG